MFLFIYLNKFIVVRDIFTNNDFIYSKQKNVKKAVLIRKEINYFYRPVKKSFLTGGKIKISFK